MDSQTNSALWRTIEAAAAPAFSADGRTLFCLRGAGLQQVWAIDLQSGDERALTRHDEKVAFVRRAPDDDRILYGIDAGGDERQQIWLWENGQSRAVTEAPGVIHGTPVWHKDGRRIVFTANDRDEAHDDVIVLELETGERRRIYEGTHEMTVGPVHKDGARLVAWEDRATGDQRPFVLSLEGAAVPVPRVRAIQASAWRWDGDGLMGLTDAHGGDFVALCRIEPATGAATAVYAPPGRDVEAWSLSPQDTGLLATIENDRGYGVLRIGPLEGERPVLAGFEAGVAADLAWSPDGRALAFAWSDPTHPSGLFVWQDGAVRQVWAAPDPGALGGALGFGLVTWAGHGGQAIEGWLARPAGTAPATGWPAVIWVHGGPASQARPGFRADMQALLAAGYAVLMPNVRGSTGYGRAFTESDDRELRLDCVHDLAAGRHWLAQQHGIDATRIAIMGQSYGGYMVNAAVTEYPELWRAAINFYGIADFVTLLQQTGPWRQAHRGAEYGDPVRHRALFDRISPLRHADRIVAPMLLLHGTRDPRVPYGESVQIEAALRPRNVPVRFETFEYAGHGFIRPDDKRRVYEAVQEWLAEHL